MGTAKAIVAEVERGGATGSHVIGSDVSHVPRTGYMFCACATGNRFYACATENMFCACATEVAQYSP